MVGGTVILFVTSGGIRGDSATEELVSCKKEYLQLTKGTKVFHTLSYCKFGIFCVSFYSRKGLKDIFAILTIRD